MKSLTTRAPIVAAVLFLGAQMPCPLAGAQKCDHGCPQARSEEPPISIAQLQQIVAGGQGKPDDRLAEQLLKVRLTERLSPASLAHFDQLAGVQSRLALEELADLSAFAPPPAAEQPADPVPPVEAQKRWLTQAVEYAAGVLSKLPNFYAARNVESFADTPATHSGGVFLPYQSLHLVGNSTATVLYRNGREVIEGEGQGKAQGAVLRGLITSGEFGSLLGTVLTDAARSSIRWDHWEQGPKTSAAVYRYSVPQDKSHYQVTFCCVPEGAALKLFRQVSAYHGEISVDPATGSILRLTLRADLHPKRPMERADILVEYGSVEIGGQNYICPLRSLAVASAAVRSEADASQPLRFRGMLSEESNDYALPVQTLLNKISFEKYHLFRADTRILPAGGTTSN